MNRIMSKGELMAAIHATRPLTGFRAFHAARLNQNVYPCPTGTPDHVWLAQLADSVADFMDEITARQSDGVD